MPILGTVSSGYVQPVYSLALTANNTQNYTVLLELIYLPLQVQEQVVVADQQAILQLALGEEAVQQHLFTLIGL